MQFERRLITPDRNLFDALDALLDGPVAICLLLTDEAGQPVDYRFLRVSQDFEAATGLSQVEGRTVRELMPGVEHRWIEHCGRVVLERRAARFEESSDVTGRRYEVRAAPVAPDGCFVLHLHDVTALRLAEEEREAALDHAQHLLRELGHRVMNSFASISAILAMEARAAVPPAREPLERVQGRVQALAALYRRLDGASQVDRVDAGDYLSGNARTFRDSLGAAASLELVCDLAPVMLSTRAAVPLGLILNELLLHAAKQAAGPDGGGRVRVTLDEADGFCRLRVAADGPGMNEAGAGIGRALVTAFVSELDGEFATEAGPDGSAATVAFRAAPPEA